MNSKVLILVALGELKLIGQDFCGAKNRRKSTFRSLKCQHLPPLPDQKQPFVVVQWCMKLFWQLLNIILEVAEAEVYMAGWGKGIAVFSIWNRSGCIQHSVTVCIQAARGSQDSKYPINPPHTASLPAAASPYSAYSFGRESNQQHFSLLFSSGCK